MKKILLILIVFSLLCFNVVFAADLIDDAKDFSEGLAVAGKWTGKWEYGYLDKNGDWEIKPQFNFAGRFCDGIAIVGMGTPESMKYGYIRKDGSYLMEPQYDYAYEFKNGYAQVGIKKGDSNVFGVIDNKGNIIAQVKYYYVNMSEYSMENGYIEIMAGDKYGLINIKNNVIIEPRFKSIIHDKYSKLRVRISEVVNGKEKYGVIFDDGRMIEPKYDGIVSFGGVKDELKDKILLVNLNGKFGLMDENENYILDPIYDEFRYFSDGFTQIKLNNKFGYLKDDGSFLTDIKYEDTSVFQRGIAIVKENGKWGFLRADGISIGKAIYDQVFSFEGDTATVVLNGKKGLLKKDGTYKLEPIYDYFIPNSEDGTTKVIKDGKETILNSDGSKAINVEYDTIGEYENGVARITLNEKIGFLKKDGSYFIKPVWDSAYKDMEEDYYHIAKNDKWGLVLADGTVIEPVSEHAVIFKNGYGVVRVDGKYTYVKSNGEYLTKERFDYIEPFRDGMGRVYFNNNTAYVNEKGELSAMYPFGDNYSEGLACVFVGDGYIFIDKNGNNAFGANAKFGYAKSFSSNLAAILINGKWGYLNHKGEIEIINTFDKAYPFYKDIAAVKMNDKYGYINKQGKYIIEPKYDMISAFENGIAGVWVGEAYGYITDNGSYYAGVNGSKNLQFNDGIAAVGVINDANGGTKWGYMKQDGSWLVKPQFDYANHFYNGSAIVYLNGKTGTISKNGTVTWK